MAKSPSSKSKRSVSMNAKKMFGLAEMEAKYGRMTFARALKAWRLCEEISQVDLAHMFGVTASTLADLESGRRIPTPARAAKIARLIGHPIATWVQLALEDHFHKEKIPLRVRVEAT